jgi:hypothetical protein
MQRALSALVTYLKHHQKCYLVTVMLGLNLQKLIEVHVLVLVTMVTLYLSWLSGLPCICLGYQGCPVFVLVTMVTLYLSWLPRLPCICLGYQGCPVFVLVTTVALYLSWLPWLPCICLGYTMVAL